MTIQVNAPFTVGEGLQTLIDEKVGILLKKRLKIVKVMRIEVKDKLGIQTNSF